MRTSVDRHRTDGARIAPCGAELVESFDGLGAGLTAAAPPRNPSDNSLAVGPDHIMQTVNSQLVVFHEEEESGSTRPGRVLYGPIATNTAFAGFGGVCEARPNGDAVVRYDQLAERWLIVMPIFRRAVERSIGPDWGRTDDRSRSRGLPVCRDSRLAGEARDGRVGRATRQGRAFRTPPPCRRRRHEVKGRLPRCPPPWFVRDVLCDERHRRPARSVLPLRVRAAAVSRLPAPGCLARWLLHADEHGRRGHSEARVRGRSREDVERACPQPSNAS